MHRKRKGKGFTIVELVIVIAVIAILAAVLIPTFSSLIKKANESADIQATRQMNLALMAGSIEGKPQNALAVINILAEAGFNSEESLIPTTKGYRFFWFKAANAIILADVSDYLDGDNEKKVKVICPTKQENYVSIDDIDNLKTLLEDFIGEGHGPDDMRNDDDSFFNLKNGMNLLNGGNGGNQGGNGGDDSGNDDPDTPVDPDTPDTPVNPDSPNNPEVTVPVSGVVVSDANIILYIGELHTLTATVDPDDATNTAVEWESSDPNVATVDQNGKVTARVVGTATITATAKDGSGVSDSCDVTVYTKITKITIRDEAGNEVNNLELAIGNTKKLTYTTRPNDPVGNSVVWSSDNPDVATVDQNGEVTARAAGTAKIIAKPKLGEYGGGEYPYCTITVVQAKFEHDTYSIYTGETLVEGVNINLEALPADKVKTVVWASSNNSVAECSPVDGKWTVAAKSAGTVEITATVTFEGGTQAKATCTVTVVAVENGFVEDVVKGENVSMTQNITLDNNVNIYISKDVTINLNGNTLTAKFATTEGGNWDKGIDVQPGKTLTIDGGTNADGTPKGVLNLAGTSGRGVIRVSGSKGSYGTLIIKNTKIILTAGTSAITNLGYVELENCELINQNPSNNLMISNGAVESIEGGARYPGTMVISNTYIGGEYKTNDAVINNKCGTLTFGANVIINAMRPVEIEGGTPYYDIVEEYPKFEVVPKTYGSATINDVVVNFETP